MLIFIDESGDAGFQMNKGSSKTFTVALVIFDDELDAEDAAIKIKQLRTELKRSNNFEFKFNKANKEFRLLFLNHIKDLNFRVRALVFQKDLIYSKNLRSSKEKFYNYALKSVLEKNSNTIENAKIRIDASSDKIFKNNLKVYLRQQLNNNKRKILKNIKFKDSKKDVLIQLADMIVSSISRSYETSKSDSQDYINIFRGKVEDIWEFK